MSLHKTSATLLRYPTLYPKVDLILPNNHKCDMFQFTSIAINFPYSGSHITWKKVTFLFKYTYKYADRLFIHMIQKEYWKKISFIIVS